MAKPVADIVGTGGLGVQLRDDWSWEALPGQRIDVLMQAIQSRLLLTRCTRKACARRCPGGAWSSLT